jgi:hypothetical protein
MSNGAKNGESTSSGKPAGGASAAPWPMPVPAQRAARIAVYAGLALLAAPTAAAGALVQSAWFPAGLILALAGAIGLFWGGAKLCRTKVGAVAPGAVWMVTVWFLTVPRPEGDLLFGAGLGSYVFLLGGSLSAVMCATIALPAPPVPVRNSP